MDKKHFRKHCFGKLRKASQRGYIKDKKIVEQLYRWVVAQRAASVMLYVPLSTEVNLFPLIAKLRRQKRRLYVPFMEGKSFRLVKYRLPLQTKQFGIQEPKDSKQYRPREIDIAIVPIVGVDVTYRRIGFGKGMYDRFYEKNRKNIKQTVFVARELCYAKEIVTDHYDIEADIIFTP